MKNSDTPGHGATPPGAGAAASLCGILLVDKPAGPTSHDIVALMRRLTRVKKVGHGGTLDPFATGLLMMLMGKATRLFDLLALLDKVYEATVQFGAVSTTGDPQGEIEQVGGTVDEEGLRRVLSRFTGKVMQRPHSFSAVKVGGEPLYRKARRGEDVRAPLRQVEIKRLDLESFDAAAQAAVLSVTCSKGTYIRSLCEDIAAALGTGAYALALRRTAIGRFEAVDAAAPAALESMSAAEILGPDNPSFISCLGALYFLPVRELSKNEALLVKNGRIVEGDEPGPVRLAHDGRLLAVYEPAGGGALRPVVVLA